MGNPKFSRTISNLFSANNKNAKIKKLILNNNKNYFIKNDFSGEENNFCNKTKNKDSDLLSESNLHTNNNNYHMLTTNSNTNNNNNEIDDNNINDKSKRSFLSLNRLDYFDSQENYNLACKLNTMRNFDVIKKLYGKTGFFKLSHNIKNLESFFHPEKAKAKKVFAKTTYQNTMNYLLNTVKTEEETYLHTLSDIKKGLQSYDYIQSVHWDIPASELLDKQMMYEKNKEGQKYFVYGPHVGHFISEDICGNRAIDRSDVIEKISANVLFKFKKIVFEKFAEKPLVNNKEYLPDKSFRAMRYRKNGRKIEMLIGDTHKRKAKVEKQVNEFIKKMKEN
jgi:hypothetical protein